MTKIFASLEQEPVKLTEERIAQYWEDIAILSKSISQREGSKNFVFYEGPPTANGMPGIHHVMSRVLKDTICKYKTMAGYRVIRKAGWDTHGLPVEIEVEKELGLKSKGEIEEYGIEAFNQKCKESVFRNEKAFAEMTKKMGYFIDLDNPYITFHNDYIETEWWILKRFYEAGLIYKGHKVLPYCARCGTGVSTHEVALGYKETAVDSVIVPFKLKTEATYFLVWTTTPWTLISNVALAINPEATYLKVRSRDEDFILAEALVTKVFGTDYKIIEQYQGRELEFKEYEQLIPSLKVEKRAFYVTLANFVTLEEGTGIVHIAPGFGEDDYEVARKYKLPVLNPVGENGKFTTGLWAGEFVISADEKIIKYLKEQGKIFKTERIKHNYPYCWRCQTPLLYYAKPSWYIAMSKLKEQLIANNQKVKWVPRFVGEKRFGNWLENVNDWAISRDRYWGTPLNIWQCKCGALECIGSRAELKKKALTKIAETLDLHRPYVDEIFLKCPECGQKMERVKEVIDCWFDSGSMPFAQYHYPFSNKALFEDQFPADFICEGIDQTRGWFYSLLAISTFIKGESPYKSVLVNDLLLDKTGQKMSKSRGNSLDPFALFEEYGADVLRWYLLYVSPVWTPTKFDLAGLKEVQAKFFNTFKNTYSFFELYANTDQVDPREFIVPYEQRTEIDQWLLSKYNQLIKNVSYSYEEYDLTKVVRLISDFVNEDLSNWYIRRNRKRFWASAFDENKKAVYNTTYEVLVGLTKITAPIIPFLAETMYQKLTKKESVHLADFPIVNETLIKTELETKMDLVRKLITLGRYAREEAGIKVRQPLGEVLLAANLEPLINDLGGLIKAELNVHNITYVSALDKYLDYEIKPNYRVAGPLFGSKIKLFATELLALNPVEINKLNEGELIKLVIAEKAYEINKEMIMLKIKAKPGFNVGMAGNTFIIINTDLNDTLIKEGIARELISKIQQMRKLLAYNVADRINIYYEGTAEFKAVLSTHLDFIKNETLAVNIISTQNLPEQFDLNGVVVGLKIEQLKS